MQTCLLVICWPPVWCEVCSWPIRAQHVRWPGKTEVERTQGQCRCAAREVHLLDSGLYRAFCSAHRETHSCKVLVLWSVSCPASCVRCSTSPSQDSCDPKAKGLGTSTSGQSQNAGVLHSSAELSHQEGKSTWTWVGGLGGHLLKLKEKTVGRPVKRGVVGLQIYRCSYYRNTVLTVLQSHVYYQSW